MILSDKPIYFNEEKFKYFARVAFERYQKTKEIPFGGHVLYDTVKKAIGAKSLIRKENLEEINRLGQIEFNRIYKVGDEIRNDFLQYATKAVALKFYFDELITAGKTLEI